MVGHNTFRIGSKFTQHGEAVKYNTVSNARRLLNS